MSDDGETALVIIAMLGHPFSPYYAAARRRAAADPLDYVAMNVALYRRDRSKWALTERRSPYRSRDALAIGTSSMEWRGDALEIRVDERTSPLPSRLRGVVTVRPKGLTGEPLALDAAGAHLWWPIAPRSRVEVAFDEPGLRFSGNAYLDSNTGDQPLEEAFRSWSWSRLSSRDKTLVSYHVERNDKTRGKTDLLFDGGMCGLEAGVSTPLPGTRWGLPRTAHGPKGVRLELAQTLEDTPFYSRSRIAASLGGERLEGVHEGLDLQRFTRPWVQALIPFRMRRQGA
ncbi:MAG: carotenoid 1,2-hydratase [Polyangiaceae bacterium]|nr:carotenoid 1,2-hydratase [Polyangiaceae bacterium]MBK8937487.1 carotenoid 1,2-hydratase [Polyangiaceae bacterium]